MKGDNFCYNLYENFNVGSNAHADVCHSELRCSTEDRWDFFIIFI
jgi:hypothetical protein